MFNETKIWEAIKPINRSTCFSEIPTNGYGEAGLDREEDI
jgi:hypothetical protein